MKIRVCMRQEVIFFSSRRRHTRYWRDWSSDVCSSDLFGRYHVGAHYALPIRIPASGTSTSHVLGAADQNPGEQHEDTAEDHLERRAPERAFHVFGPYPRDGEEFDRDHDGGNGRGREKSVGP